MRSRTSFFLRVATDRAIPIILRRWGGRIGMVPVVGYPKSGGTWTSQMVATALRLPFARLSFLPVAMPSVVQGHWRHSPDFPRGVVVIRDGRDVMVSFYHYCRLQYETEPSPTMVRWIHRYFGRDADLKDARANLPRFIEGMFRTPIGAKVPWHVYCREWHDRANAVPVRYEALLGDTEHELGRVVRALDPEADETLIRLAVEAHDMRRVTGRRPGVENRDSFIRKGVAGDWAGVFNDEARERFAERAGETLVRLGYERTADWRRWTGGDQAGEAAGSKSASPYS